MNRGNGDFACHCERSEAIPMFSAFEWDCRVVSLLAMTVGSFSVWQYSSLAVFSNGYTDLRLAAYGLRFKKLCSFFLNQYYEGINP